MKLSDKTYQMIKEVSTGAPFRTGEPFSEYRKGLVHGSMALAAEILKRLEKDNEETHA